MKMQILYMMASIIGGTIAGSFLNVAVSRRDWYKGRSRCDSCGKELKWYDLIPILSYVLLLGKCRYCKTKISPSHFFSEIMGGIIGWTMYFVIHKYTQQHSWDYSVHNVCTYLLPMLITLVVLGYESIHDINSKTTATIPIYLAMGIIICLKLYDLGLRFEPTYVISVSFIYGMYVLVCMSLSVLAKKYIGAGDLDVYCLITLTAPIYGMILLIASLGVFVKKSLCATGVRRIAKCG